MGPLAPLVPAQHIDSKTDQPTQHQQTKGVHLLTIPRELPDMIYDLLCPMGIGCRIDSYWALTWYNGSHKIAVPFDSILLEVTGMSELCLKNVVKFAFWVGRLAKLTAVKKSQLLGVGDEYLKVLVSLKPQRSTDVPFEEQELDLLQRNLERVASLGVGNAMLLGPSLRTLEHVPFDSILPEVTGSGELCIITPIELASRISRPAILRYCRRVSLWGSGMSI
ncbi:hypothetical protein LTR97_008710 [Elasticomyces elasticus]|uniref:Uncharacterized protein n=1 Tax=Elasticomyces elasticus TaxID=574655 RepID=A0AAN7W627_9PEZI|nr:hypothetical protein LTR97_008710 [Elasticomyces elasticus]